MNAWEGNEDANLQECKLLSGGFATFLQVLLGIIALSVLVFKRYQEVPRRPVTIWAFDASKQMVGAGFAHIANLLIAIMLYQYEHADEHGPRVDQCAFYFVNFTMDTSIGVFLNWVFLEMFSSLAQRYEWTSLTTPGDYGNPIQVSIWLKQLTSWIVIIFLTKFVIALIIIVFEKPLGRLAIWMFRPLQPHPDVELVLVMIACPCLMNALQFWVQDSFLKKDVRDDCMLASAQSPDKAEMMEKAASGGGVTILKKHPPTGRRPIVSGADDTEDDTDDAYNSDASTATSVSVASKSGTDKVDLGHVV